MNMSMSAGMRSPLPKTIRFSRNSTIATSLTQKSRERNDGCYPTITAIVLAQVGHGRKAWQALIGLAVD
jgi:hypothetical protein